MTNAELFKTAAERTKAYAEYIDVELHHKREIVNQFDWLENEVDILKPCPFCGSKAGINSGTEDFYVVCQNDDCAASLIARSFSSVEEAIAKWNRRVYEGH